MSFKSMTGAKNNLTSFRTLTAYLSLVLSLITAVALSIESYMNRAGNSLCQTSACEVVGQYLTIPADLLVTIGALSFWLLSILIFFSLRYPAKLGAIPLLVLAAALSFDAGLIGFQFFTIKEICILCLLVASSLLIIFFLYAASRRAWLIIAICLMVWVGGFGVQSLVNMPEPNGASRSMILLKTIPAKVHTVPKGTTITLIFSMQCPHCLELINEISELKYLSEISWQFASTDQDLNSYKRLATFLKKVPNSSTPFKLLSQIKENPPLNDIAIPDLIKNANRKTLSFLSNMGINSVPVLLVENSGSQKTLLIGKNAATRFLKEDIGSDARQL